MINHKTGVISLASIFVAVLGASSYMFDDWGLVILKRHQYQDFLDIFDDRHGSGSMPITSQFPTGFRHDLIGDPTVADSTLGRLVHNTHAIEPEGESRQKKKKEGRKNQRGGGR